MSDGPHHSIGEVLSLLKAEHEDVTISKIRFLESQGLIEPERTPSGYRKFYDADIDRLRWILTQQRDNYLPLKVIKKRLADEGFDPAQEIGDHPMASPLPEPSLFTQHDAPGAAPDDAPAPDGEVAAPPQDSTPPAVPRAEPLGSLSGSVSLTAAEVAATAGVDPTLIPELERLGLVAPVATADGSVYNEEAVVVARAAAAMAAAGLQTRHLRMFKVAADREIGLFAQLQAAALARGGAAAQTARAELAELARHGETIHRSLLRRELGLPLDG